MVGNPIDGVTLIGPFEDAVAAAEIAESRNRGVDYWVISLKGYCPNCDGYGLVYVDGSGCNDYSCPYCGESGVLDSQMDVWHVEALMEHDIRRENMWVDEMDRMESEQVVIGPEWMDES